MAEKPVVTGPSDGKHRSLWLQEAGLDHAQPPLTGSSRTDVAIVGGGYVGLWTALRLRELDASVQITVVEADVCGGGASGRNGGMVLSWWPKLSSLTALFGSDEALRLIRASEDAIDEIGEFCRLHSPESEFRRAGWLWTATAAAHDSSWAALVDLAQQHRPGAFEPKTPEEVAVLSGSPVHLSGVLEPRAATVQPGQLVRAMRRVALERGITIHEHARMRRLHRGSSPSVETARGHLHADRVVLATNAWAAGLRELHLRLFVSPATSWRRTSTRAARRDRVAVRAGDQGLPNPGLLLPDHRLRPGRVRQGWMVDRSRRVHASGDGAPFGPGRHGQTGLQPLLPHAPRRAHHPRLGGPIDRTYNSLPILDWLTKDKNIAVGVGWSGNGVGPSVVGGKILASMVLGQDDEWSNAGLVGAPARYFPPDPIRFVGAHLVREAIIRKERSEALDLEPARIATLLSRLAPTGLEDKTRQ